MSELELAIQIAVRQWDHQLLRATQLIEGLTDQDWEKQISPGKNRGKYLVGHLIAIHDAMAELLGLGDREYPELTEVYIHNPDSASLPGPSISELKNIWNKVHYRLKEGIPGLTASDWFTRHQAVSDEDFVKEPYRNKYSILLSRTQHFGYHIGQLRLL